MNDFFCLDFEASGLNMALSYPIEVGYTNGTYSYSTLIVPNSNWDYWDLDSEKIHNIKRDELFSNGQIAPVVCQKMNGDLAGKIVYVDGGMYDMQWCHTLFQSAGLSMQFTLTFLDIELHKIWIERRKDLKPTHRALQDAVELHDFLSRLLPPNKTEQ